jgi:hypothetical protein
MTGEEVTMSCPLMRDETKPPDRDTPGQACVSRDGERAYGEHGHCLGCDGNPLEIEVAREARRG